MALVLKNTKTLITPENLSLNILIHGFPGSGKTAFYADAPELGVAACETGMGNGLATIAAKGVDYVEPKSYADFDALCSLVEPAEFKTKKTIALDSLSDMASTFIKDYALSFARAKGATQKRQSGIPELDDYGVMGEVTRRLVRKLIDSKKHIIATATTTIQMPDADTGVGQMLVKPNLPGQLSLGASAMFDIVLLVRTRSKLRDPKDPKSRFTEHYITSKGSDGIIAKCRHNEVVGAPLLPDEFVLDAKNGIGTFNWVLERIKTGYADAAKKQAA